MVIVAAVAQAAALATGPIALGAADLHHRAAGHAGARRAGQPQPRCAASAALDRHRATTAALGAGLAVAQPAGAIDSAQNTSWVIALLVTALFEAVLIILAMGTSGEPRAALLGLAAACGYALTAALMKNAMADLERRARSSSSPTGTSTRSPSAGVGSLFLLQNALQAGSLVASQPMLTVGDALISISLGVTLFSEDLRVGWWLLPQIVALGGDHRRLRPDREVPARRRYRGTGLGTRVDGTVIV